jgi:mannonate dehydratase
MSGKMRVAIGSLRGATEEDLLFAKQLGVEGIVLNTPPFRGEASFGSGALGGTYWVPEGVKATVNRWDTFELVQEKRRIEDFGLRLEALENVPIWFYDKAMLGLPGRDEQIENYRETIRAVGRAGIPILGYHWMPTRVWRTSKTTEIRGHARCSSFDMALVEDTPPLFGRVFGEEEMWDNYAYFIKAVLPVAEEAGVKLALHPDDPPVPSLGGVARILRNIEGFRRALEIGDSPNHGLDFCMGTWSEMGVERMMEGLNEFGERGKILFIHFRNIKGTVPKFRECFIDEGDVDLVAVLRCLKRMKFDGFLIDDHVPRMVNDSVWGHRSRAYATGYIAGLLRAVEETAP